MLKCIGIVVNLNKDITLDVTRLLIELLEKRGIEPLLFGDVAEKLGRPVINRATFFNRSNAIFVLGGDGTVNEVVNGIKRPDLITFGYIPIGSSNDFARGLKLPKDPMKALQSVLSPKKLKLRICLWMIS